jgi:hypothetical protein
VSRTSLSTPELSPRTECGLSCTNEQCPEPMDHRDWGPSTLNKSTTELARGEYHNRGILSVRLTFRDGQCGRPLIPQDVQANGAIGVDVGVVDLGREADLGGLEGIIGWEAYREEENATGVGGIALCIRSLGETAQQAEKRHTGPIIVACH